MKHATVQRAYRGGIDDQAKAGLQLLLRGEGRLHVVVGLAHALLLVAGPAPRQRVEQAGLRRHHLHGVAHRAHRPRHGHLQHKPARKRTMQWKTLGAS